MEFHSIELFVKVNYVAKKKKIIALHSTGVLILCKLPV